MADTKVLDLVVLAAGNIAGVDAFNVVDISDTTMDASGSNKEYVYTSLLADLLADLSGTASGLTAGNVTTSANLTGHVTSVGNAAVLGSFTMAQLSAAVSDGAPSYATGVENNADVTDTANVTSAGALMDSELADLAAVKAINQSLVTSAGPQFATLELGAASDTTLARVSAGLVSVEGDTVALLTATQTLSGKTLSAPNITASVITTTVDSGWTGTEALDPANGDIQEITMTGNVTTLTDNMADGESIIMQVDDGSAFAITWPTITWTSDSATAPTLQTAVDTIITIWKSGSTLFGHASNGV